MYILWELFVLDIAVENIRMRCGSPRSDLSTYNSLELFLLISNLLEDDFVRRLLFLVHSPMPISG